MIYALGAFDGFHTGHQKLLETAQIRSRKRKTDWGVITFDVHPQMLFNKDGFKFLFTSDERDMLVKYFDIPFIKKIPFTRTLAEMLPEEFLDYISLRDDIDGLVTGENFRFGRARIGTPEMLSGLCAERGWSLDVVDSFMQNGVVVSSTVIRDAVLRGQLDAACSMLGHPFIIQGRVIHGERRGRSLGFPTANIAVKTGKVYPARGSYAGLIYLESKWRSVALNIGFNPTFDGARGLRCEAHIAGYDGDLYEKNITLFVVARNREEMKFPTPEALVQQLGRDVRLTQATAFEYKEKHDNVLAKFVELLL